MMLTPPPSNEIVWTMKDGQQLTMQEIGNDHLCNIIRLLERRHVTLLYERMETLNYRQGEHTFDAIEYQMDRTVERILELLNQFRTEAHRRNIKLK